MIALAAVLAVIIAITSGSGVGANSDVGQQSLFEQFVTSGGPVVWFVLLPMSFITVYLVTEGCLTIRRKKLLPVGTGADIVGLIRRFGLGRLEARIAGRSDFVSVAVVKALGQSRGDWFRMRNALAESLQEQCSMLLRKIEWLNLLGNVSPMVGLFGTIFGMIKLFNAIVIAGGQPKPVQLADGISVALVTTFWGMFIAIPALAIHGIFRNRIETLASDAVTEAENIIPEIRRSLKKLQNQQQQAKSLRAGQIKQSLNKSEIRDVAGSSAGKIRQTLH